MRHNVREDVVLYMTEWARMLEEQLIPYIKIDLSFLEEENFQKVQIDENHISNPV